MERRTHSAHGALHGRTDGRRVMVPTGLRRSTCIVPRCRRGPASAGQAVGEERRCLQQGCCAKPPSRASRALPKMPITNPPGQQRPRDDRWVCAQPGGMCGGAFGGEQGGLRQGDQFLLGHSQHGVTAPAESLQIPASLRAATERSCPGSATLAQPRGQLPWSGALLGCQQCHSVPRSHQHPCSALCLQGLPAPIITGMLNEHVSLP